MKNYYNHFMALDADAKKNVHIQFCRFSLAIWDAFVRKGSDLIYYDSVLGIKHPVDIGIPTRALQAVVNNQSILEIEKSYMEPIVALQDMDWQPPDTIEFAYYSIYNLYQKYCQDIDVDDWLIINQCMAAQSNEESRKTIIESFKTQF